MIPPVTSVITTLQKDKHNVILIIEELSSMGLLVRNQQIHLGWFAEESDRDVKYDMIKDSFASGSLVEVDNS